MLKKHAYKAIFTALVTSLLTGCIAYEENTKITVKDTGWSEEEKERMQAFGYDSLDMVRAWYS